MPDALILGPLVLPPWLALALAAWVASAITQQLVKRRPETDETTRSAMGPAADRLGAAALTAFAAWKLTPVIRYPELLLSDPVSLLRLPGGNPGLLLGSVAGLLVLAVATLRQRRLARPLALLLAGAALGGLIGLGALSAVGPTALGPSAADPVALVNQEARPLAAGASSDAASSNAAPPLITAQRPAVLTFWATWCGPCRAELPVKQSIWEQWGDQIDVVAVNMTRTEAGVAAVRDYVERHGLPYPVALDENGRLAEAFAVRGTPTTVVIAPDGSIVDRWVGPSSFSRISSAIRSSQQRVVR